MKKNDNIIDGRQSLFKHILEFILSLLGWLYILTYVGYVIYGVTADCLGLKIKSFLIYNQTMIHETELFFLILLIAALVVVLILILWKSYNYQRFGKLDRRKFRDSVSTGEIAEYFHISPEEIEKMKSEKYIVLERNIISDSSDSNRAE